MTSEPGRRGPLDLRLGPLEFFGIKDMQIGQVLVPRVPPKQKQIHADHGHGVLVPLLG